MAVPHVPMQENGTLLHNSDAAPKSLLYQSSALFSIGRAEIGYPQKRPFWRISLPVRELCLYIRGVGYQYILHRFLFVSAGRSGGAGPDHGALSQPGAGPARNKIE